MSEASKRTGELIGAYLEMMLGIFSLRLPAVQAVLQTHPSSFSINTSMPGIGIMFDGGDMTRVMQSPSAPALAIAVGQVSRMFVAAMWDTLTAQGKYPSIATEPEIQFLRHLRNACAHDGRFNFTELKHPAQWRGKQITMTEAGTIALPGFLADGDLMLLMLDIDERYFEGPGVTSFFEGKAKLSPAA